MGGIEGEIVGGVGFGEDGEFVFVMILIVCEVYILFVEVVMEENFWEICEVVGLCEVEVEIEVFDLLGFFVVVVDLFDGGVMEYC